jgi:hypothetical protein
MPCAGIGRTTFPPKPARASECGRSYPDTAAPFPRKPKGMWRQTYQRLREQAMEAEMAAEEPFALSVGRLLARIDHPNRKRSFWR